MALVLITVHDTEHGLEVSAVWDKPLNPAYLKTELLAKKHLTPAQGTALAMLSICERQLDKPQLIGAEKKPLVVATDLDGVH